MSLALVRNPETIDYSATPNLELIHSELLFELASVKWLSAPNKRAALHRLATVLRGDHQDGWLEKFLSAGASPNANAQLEKALTANRSGDLDSASKAADDATSLFERAGNAAGVARARLEHLYFLRRSSQGKKCVNESKNLYQAIEHTDFSWLRTQLLIERSSCLAMTDNLDDAWVTALRARASADSAHYPALQLRAIAMEAALHANEGRSAQAWEATTNGLRLFLDQPFPGERGFQFYSELEFSAEESAQWHLAALLQKEAIACISSIGRLDFEATAHFHLAAVDQSIGESTIARDEVLRAQSILNRISPSLSRDFLEAESKIALASLEAASGSPASAANYLSGLDGIVSHADNFTISLKYEQAWADVERRNGNPLAEEQHLQRIITIGNDGFATLHSPRDRYEWEQVVGRPYRRLIELHLDRPHDSLKVLAQWENYRLAASSITPNRSVPDNEEAIKQLKRRFSALGDAAVISFAVLPNRVVAWVGTKRGVREAQLSISPSELAASARKFRLLCSDPLSPLEKVKDAGSRLYQSLLSPLESEMQSRKILFIESDGPLGTLPWPALSTADGKYLGATFAIVNVPQLLSSSEDNLARRQGEFLVAYPGTVKFNGQVFSALKYAQQEAENLAREHEGSVYLEGQGVTSQNLVNHLPQSSTFHFAGHAVSRGFGGELLVHGPNGGELLSASTISSLDLRNLRLAVLSACNTATSVETSRNPNGLVGAFIAAGTRRIIASEWEVDSKATEELMSDFYSRLNTSGEAVEAIWQGVASRKLLLHPYWWAGFQLYGFGVKESKPNTRETYTRKTHVK